MSAALAVIQNAGEREPKELWTAEPPGDKVAVYAASDERNEAAFVTQGILEARRAGESEQQLAVFYRPDRSGGE